MTSITSALQRHEHRTLALMLALLHVVIWWDFGGGVSRSLMLAHLGLFLLWQPLLRTERRLDWRTVAGFALIPLAFVSALSWLLLGLWLLLLIGLVGGRTRVSPTMRMAYLGALVYLVVELLVGWLPRMFAVPGLSTDFMEVFRHGLYLLPAMILLVPAHAPARDTPDAPAVDFLYALGVSVLSLVIAMGALLSTLILDTPYPVAIIQALMATALFLLALAWIWAPVAGFSGLGQLWERYVQNAGTPLELWLDDLQRSARASGSPERFLDVALERLLALPWVAGIEWRDGARSGTLGELTRHVFHGRSDTIQIAVHGYRRMGTALMLHARLLIQLIGHFHRAKVSERDMARQAKVSAVYETGARMTHDIKNLLQSLKAMSRAVEQAEGHDPSAASRLVQRQLPLITQRLQLALDKLQAPLSDASMSAPAGRWWQTLEARNTGQDIDFEARLEADPHIPVELFDSVAENLIENARFKRRGEPGIRIQVSLHCDQRGCVLRVSDDGTPVTEALRAQLCRAPVPSPAGLGIGLYQAARHAEKLGYRLRLMPKRKETEFELAPASRTEMDTARPTSAGGHGG
jgi:signal transduction histidine kinase